jgi:hypothetical protein
VTEEDIPALEALIRLHPEIGEIKRALVLCPDGSEAETQMAKRIWDGCYVEHLRENDWNFMEPCPRNARWDIAIACNTFMCATDPGLWLRNISAVVDFIAIQDLATSRREGSRYCGVSTRDVARYSVSCHGIIGETDPELEVFDLSTAGYRVVGAAPYTRGKFVAILDLRPQVSSGTDGF